MTALRADRDLRRLRLILGASGFALAAGLGAGPSAAQSLFWDDPAPSQAETLAAPSGIETGGVTLTPSMGELPPAGAAGAARGAGASGGPAPVTARRLWKTSVRPYAATSVTVTDNARLDPRGHEESDATLTGTVGLRAAAEGARGRGSLNYAAHYDHDLDGSNDDGLRHDLAGAFSAAVVPGLLNLDVAGSAAESFLRDGGRYSLNPSAGRDERERVYFGTASPSLHQNLGGWANAELRYTYARTFYDSDDEDALDEWMHGFSASLSSDPRRFQSFGWGFSAAHARYDDAEDYERQSSTVGGSVEIPVGPRTAVMGAAGWDEVEGSTLEDDVGGAYVNAGLRYVPNPRLDMDGYLGWRNQRVDYGANLRYALARRLGISASLARSVEFLDFGGAPYALLNLGTDSEGQPIYRSVSGGLTSNRAEALAVSLADGSIRPATDPAFSRQTQDAVTDSATLALSATTGRTGVSLVGAAVRRDYGGPQDDDEWTLTLAAALNRDLTGRLGVDASAAFILYAPDDPTLAHERTLSFGLGASYRITEIVNAFARYTYTRRFSDSSADEYQENAGVLGLRANF